MNNDEKERGLVCPVCGEEINVVNLPDKGSVVEDTLDTIEGLRFVGPVVVLVDFEHQFSDLGVSLENPHSLVAVTKCDFDGEGRCRSFKIVEVRERR